MLCNSRQQISRWRQGEIEFNSHRLPRGVSAESQVRLRTVAALYHYAAVIYFHSIVAEVGGVIVGDDLMNESSPPCMSEQEALARFCEILEANEIGHHCEYSALVFPLFIAACEARSASEQQLIFGAMRRLGTNFGIGNVAAAIEVVRRVWASHGRRKWFQVLEESDWDLVLA